MHAMFRLMKGLWPGLLLIGLASSALLLTDLGKRQSSTMTSRHAPEQAGPYEVVVIRYNDAQFSDDTRRGIMDGFAASGFIEGRDFSVKTLNAQGDMAVLNSIVTAVVAEDPDLIMPISTPALQAVLRRAAHSPVVFSSVGDAVRAGAGESVSNHLPNVTGITTKSPFAGMAKLIRNAMPNVRSVGTLFSPGEINSTLYRGWFYQALKAEGINLVAVPVNSSAEVSDAAVVMLRSDIQVIAQISDNTTRPAYGQIAQRASAAGIPFLCFDSAGMQDGACLALARDFYHTGLEAAQVAVRVLLGENPAHIPFENTKSEILATNPALLKRFNIRLSRLDEKRSVRCPE